MHRDGFVSKKYGSRGRLHMKPRTDARPYRTANENLEKVGAYDMDT
jgi:hypothetical protein